MSDIRFPILLLTILALLFISAERGDAQFSVIKPEKKIKLNNVILANQPTPAPVAVRFGKSSSRIQLALQPLMERVSDQVVVLESSYGQKSLGTVVSPQGLIVGKRSDLTRSLKCTFNGETIRGTVLASHTEYDLALIVVDPSELSSPMVPIRFKSQTMADASLQTGKMVVSFSNQKDSAKLGTISVRKQRFPVEQPACTDCVNLGAIVSNYLINKTLRTESEHRQVQGLVVTRVYPRTASERCGLLVDDLLFEVNGKPISNNVDLNKLAQNLHVGQQLKLAVLRNGERLELSTIINRLSPRMPHDLWGGGPFSEKRFGFAEVITHDSTIRPEDCGGPLLGLNGDVIGVNIARSMRVATFAVTLEKVHYFLKLAKPDIVLSYE